MLRVMLLVGALVLTQTTSATAADYKTPEDAFKAMKEASEKKDFKGLVGLLTDQGKEDMVYGVTVIGVMVKGFMEGFAQGLQEDQKQQLKQLQEAFKKHGITDEAMTSTLDPKKPKPANKEETIKELNNLLKPVKDREAYMIDILSSFGKEMKTKYLELKDVKVDGDTATGIVVQENEGRKKEEKYTFKKVKDSWKIQPPSIIEGMLNGPGK